MKSSDDSLPGDMLYMLRIPSIDSENPVREGIDGAVLKDSLGHDTNSSYAGTNGKCVIAGHRNYTFNFFFIEIFIFYEKFFNYICNYL